MSYTNIEQLLKEVKTNIEDENLRINSVGNRPHYPVFIAFNGANVNCCSIFVNNICKIWSKQISKNLLSFKYQADRESIDFRSIDDEIIELESVYNRISEVSKTRDVFDSKSLWCLYNVIDVTDTDSFEDFTNAYNAKERLIEVIDENVRSMLVVIIKESRNKVHKELNYKIRKYLSENNLYDGVVIVSNRTRGGDEYEIGEVYRIASNTVLLSNNDAVSTIDDTYYSERIIKLYNRTPYVLSYNSIKKPTEDILNKMVLELISTVRYNLDSRKTTRISSNEIDEIIGISNNRVGYFEGFIKEIVSRFRKEHAYIDIVMGLPLKKQELITEEIMSSKRFSEIENLINTEVLELILKDYCMQFFEGEEGTSLLKGYKELLNDHINLLNINSISDEMIESAFVELSQFDKPNKEDYISVYICSLLVYTIKNRIIFPFCLKQLQSLYDKSNVKETENNIKILENEIDENLPISGFEEIAELYGEHMSDYLKTTGGMKRIKELLRIGNEYTDLYKIVEQTLIDANDFCNGNIKMPFISLWASALKLHGSEVFNRIRNTLNGDGEDGIMLRGGYPVNEELSVYLMHAYDADGQNPTSLYKQFEEAYRNVMNVQFFNTGNDDSIESIKFYKCEGTNLILGLNN